MPGCTRTQGYVSRTSELRPRPNAFTLIELLLVIGIIAVYIALLKTFGYFVMTFVMMATFQTVFARKHDLRYILIWCVGLSLVITAALWVVFAKLFLIPMP